MRASLRALSALALLCAVLGSTSRATAAPSPPAPPSGQVGAYYLALGDSLAYGVTAPGITPDPTCKSPTAPGYVCVVYGYLKGAAPQLALVNLSAPDVDSCVLVHGYGNGSPCVNRPGPGDMPSPLRAAVNFIHDHPGQVGPVTINIGGADLIPLLPAALSDPAGTAAKLPGLIQGFTANLDTALAQLRAALGPSGEIVVVTQYNPLGGIGSPPLPAGLPEIARGAIHSLDVIMAAEASKYGASVADVEAAFDKSPGGAALLTFVPTSLAAGDPSKIDIYPTQEGYRLFGVTVLRAIGVASPRKLKAKATPSRAKRGTRVKLKVSTTGSASLEFTVRPPHSKPRRLSTVADDVGTASLRVAIGKRKGVEKVKVCSTDPVENTSACVTVKVTVR